MARSRSPNRDKAFEIYKEHKGDIKLIDIASMLNIKDTQVRKWKSQDKWDEILKGTLPKIKSNKSNVTNKKVTKKSKKEDIINETKELLDNSELNDKQKLFCVLYSKSFNATKSYQKAYKCTYETAMVNGPKSLRNTRIKQLIDELVAPTLDKEILSRGIIQKYIDIAFSDIGDYVKFGKKYVPQWTKDKDGNDIPVIDPETGQQKIYEYNYVDLNESSMVDTSLITEISEGKQGIKFKLADKMKALEFLNKHCNLLNDEEKMQLDIENKKLQNDKLKAELDNLNGDDSTEPIRIEFVKASERNG